MAATAILDFRKFKILTVDLLQDGIHHLAKFHQNWSITEIWRFYGFFKWWSSAIWDLLGAYWDHTR